MEEFEKSHDDDIGVKTEICDESGFTSESFSKTQPFVLSDEKPYNCDQCDNIFESFNAFELHIKEHDEHEIIHNFDTVCNTIDPLALCSSVLKVDSPDQNEEKPWRCDKCGKIFDSLSALELHVSDHVQDVYPCTQCNTSLTVFKSENELQSHTEKNHIEVSSSRPVTSFNWSSYVGTNKTIRSVKKRYSCVWCERIFYNVRFYKKHIGLLMAESFSCCQMTFECEGLLQAHANTMHVTPNRELNNSMDTETSFTCSKCNQSFRCTESLQSHACSKSHTCETCNKSFQLESSLKRHMNSHTNKNSYQCEVCNRSYALRESFICHKRLHHGLTDDTCNICNKSFKTRKSLLLHKHKQHISHTCKICNKSYKTRKSLLLHKRKQHVSLTCKVCKKSFEARESLLLHKCKN